MYRRCCSVHPSFPTLQSIYIFHTLRTKTKEFTASFNFMFEISSILPYQIVWCFFNEHLCLHIHFFPFVIFSTDGMQSKKEKIQSTSIHHKYCIVAYDKYALKILFPNYSYNKDMHFYSVDTNNSCSGHL